MEVAEIAYDPENFDTSVVKFIVATAPGSG